MNIVKAIRLAMVYLRYNCTVTEYLNSAVFILKR